MADAAGKDKKDRLRICTIKEIVDTERAYLNTLEFISTVRIMSINGGTALCINGGQVSG